MSAQPPAPARASTARPDPMRRGARRAWIAFAAGLEGFNVPIVYVIFAPYFATRVASDPATGQALWGQAVALSGLVAALLAPPIAFLAERAGPRRALLTLFVLLNAVGAAALWFAAPAAPVAVIVLVLAAYGVAAAANDWLYAVWGAMLPDVADEAVLGRTSGAATAIGWLVAIALTGVFAAVVILPAAPPFGLDPAAGEPARLSGPFAAILIIVFCLPLLLAPAPPRHVTPARPFTQWWREEVASLLSERLVAIAVSARLVYWSGVVLVMLFGNILATGVFGWDGTGSAIFGGVVLLTSAVGAGVGGLLDDRLGSRNALILALVGLAIALAALLSITPDRLFGMVPVTPRAEDAAMLSSLGEQVAIGVAAVTGLFLGAVGPVARTLIARLAPPGRVARYFGFAALAGNATNFAGPALVAWVTIATGDQRLGLVVAPAFLLAGAAILLALPARTSARATRDTADAAD